MIKTKAQLRDYLDLELSRYKFNFITYHLQIGERDIIRKYLWLLRNSEYYLNTNKKLRALIFRIRLMKMSNKYSLHIPLNVCEKGLRIMHVGPILINYKSKVGENCVLYT